MRSVLQDWVMALPLRHQGSLLTCIRSCDVSPKNPACIDETYGCSTGESSPDRRLVAWLRNAILVPADAREIGVPGAWFQDRLPTEWKPSQFGHFPQHWYAHLMHSYEIVGYKHPNEETRRQAYEVYRRLVKALHLNPETEAQMDERLLEDRIAKGEVVS